MHIQIITFNGLKLHATLNSELHIHIKIKSLCTSRSKLAEECYDCVIITFEFVFTEFFLRLRKKFLVFVNKHTPDVA